MALATTHVLMVIDASGSMYGLADDVRGGHNQMLDKLRKDGGDYRISVTTFNYDIRRVCEAVPLSRAPKLDADNYTPAGMTALLAAVAKTVEAFEQRVPYLAHDERVMLVISTDGKENYSHNVDPIGAYTWNSVSKMLTEREKRGWNIVYLGATADAWDQGHQLGLRGDAVLRTQNTSDGTYALYDSLAAGTIAYASGSSPVEVSGLIAKGLADGNE